MSRYYQMTLEVYSLDPEEVDTVMDAIRDIWSWDTDTFFDDLCNHETGVPSHVLADRFYLYEDHLRKQNKHTWVQVEGRDNLCGGEDEESFTNTVCKRVWEKIGRWVPIVVMATYLDELPYELHSRDMRDYQQLMGSSKA